jgi:hypothetical protein
VPVQVVLPILQSDLVKFDCKEGESWHYCWDLSSVQQLMRSSVWQNSIHSRYNELGLG